jgi:hypothetical protein
MTARSPFLLRMRTELKQLGTQAARRQNRSFNGYLEYLIMRDLNLELPITLDPEADLDIDFEK